MFGSAYRADSRPVSSTGVRSPVAALGLVRSLIGSCLGSVPPAASPAVSRHGGNRRAAVSQAGEQGSVLSTTVLSCSWPDGGLKGSCLGSVPSTALLPPRCARLGGPDASLLLHARERGGAGRLPEPEQGASLRVRALDFARHYLNPCGLPGRIPCQVNLWVVIGGIRPRPAPVCGLSTDHLAAAGATFRPPGGPCMDGTRRRWRSGYRRTVRGSGPCEGA